MSADRVHAGAEPEAARVRQQHDAASRAHAPEAAGRRSPPVPPVSLAAQLLQLQRTAGNRGVEALLGTGTPLDPPLRRRLEARVGASLEGVRLHSGRGAAWAAAALRARAFTVGRHIGFAAGELGADRAGGERLLTHEAAHVAQQRRGPASLSAAEADARAVARGSGPARSGAPPNAVFLADATTATDPAARNDIVLDDTEWTPDDEDALLSFRVNDKFFLLSAYPAILRVPPRQAAEVRTMFGVPAVGSAGSAVVSTGHGRALMIDVGSGIATRGRSEVPVGIYLDQLEALVRTMGVTAITDVRVTHGHLDHGNRLYDTVLAFDIPAENVIVPDYQVRHARFFRESWRRLAETNKGRELRYDRVQPGATLYVADPSAQVYRARLETGDLVLEFYADAEAVRELAETEPGKAASTLLDTASALIRISQRGTPFRMAVVGDLRGRDIHGLREKMDNEQPGSFARVFAGVEVAGGMQHHLGVVNSSADLAGIADILEVTALARGRLEVVVQTDDRQMRPQLVEALNILGVDVTVALTAGEEETANVTVTSESAVARTGAATQRFEAPAASRAAIQRIAELRQREQTLARFGRGLQKAGAVADPEALRTELASARGDLETAYRELQQQTIGRLVRSNAPRRATASTMDAARFDQAEISSRIARIMAPQPVEQSLQETWEGFTIAGLLDLLGNQDRMDKELFEQVRTTIETGRTSERARQLIEIISPAYVREVIKGPPASEREAGEQLMWMSRQAQLSQAGYNAGPARPYGGPVPLSLRGGAAALVALQAAQIGLEVAASEKAHRAILRHQAFADFVWWNQKGACPPFAGVIDHWGTKPDEVITVVDEAGNVDQSQWKALKKREDDINALTLGLPQDDGSWFRFTLWVTNRIQNFDDFQEHFVEGDPPVKWEGHFDTGKWSVRVSTWSDWLGPSSQFEESEQLTRIMNATATRVIPGTKAAIERAWAQRQEPLPQEPTAISRVRRPPPRGPGRSPLEELRPTRRARFAEDADHVLFSVAAQRQIIGPRDWPSKTPPYFLVFDNESAPPGLAVVGGADYNTYATIRMAWTYEYTGLVPIRRNTSILFRIPALSQEEDAALRATVDTPGLAEYLKHPDTDRDYEAEVRYVESTPNYAAIALARVADLAFEP